MPPPEPADDFVQSFQGHPTYSDYVLFVYQKVKNQRMLVFYWFPYLTILRFFGDKGRCLYRKQHYYIPLVMLSFCISKLFDTNFS